MRFLKLLSLATLSTLAFGPTVYAETTFNELDFDSGTQIVINTSFTRPAKLESSLYTVTTRTTSGIPVSPSNPVQGPYQIKLWVSVGSEADPADAPRSSTFVGFGVPDPDIPVTTTELNTRFRLPTPNNSTPSQLLQPGLIAADLIGTSVYVKLCIEQSGRDLICAVDSIDIHPERPTFLESPSLTQVNRATLYWNTIPTANGQPLAHGHRISFLNQNDSSDEGSVYVPRANNSQLVFYNDEQRNRLVLQANQTRPISRFSPKPGVAYQATLQACGQLNAICGGSLVIQNVTAFSSEFTASEGTDTDAVNISWVTHAPNISGYSLRRCLASNSNSCTNIAVGSNATNYRDTSAIPNVRYRYTVFAGSVATGITNAGFRAQETPNPATFLSASDGTKENQIDVNWSEFSPTASNFSRPGYLIEITNPDSSDNLIVRPITYQPNQANTSFITGSTSGLVAGVLYDFNVNTCANFDLPSRQCARSANGDTGFARALFASGSPRAGVAQIDWISFSADTLRYRLERCTDAATPQCEFIELENQNATTYQDRGLTEGKRYRYSVFACRTSQNSQCSKTGSTEFVQIVGNVQPDEFEDDDSPLLLNNPNQTIQASATQSRSFDEADDQDWTRITFASGVREFDIRTASGLQSLDTQLTLFNARGRLVACALNNENEVTGDARLRIANLPAGEYFLRVEQQDTGLILEPIENYILTTTISVNSTGPTLEFPDCSVVDDFPGNLNTDEPIITPILQILLLD